jgi:hypothetical protein
MVLLVPYFTYTRLFRLLLLFYPVSIYQRIFYGGQWTWYSPEDATWEHEEVMRAEYPHIFENFERLAETV